MAEQGTHKPLSWSNASILCSGVRPLVRGIRPFGGVSEQSGTNMGTKSGTNGTGRNHHEGEQLPEGNTAESLQRSYTPSGRWAIPGLHSLPADLSLIDTFDDAVDALMAAASA